ASPTTRSSGSERRAVTAPRTTPRVTRRWPAALAVVGAAFVIAAALAATTLVARRDRLVRAASRRLGREITAEGRSVALRGGSATVPSATRRRTAGRSC